MDRGGREQSFFSVLWALIKFKEMGKSTNLSYNFGQLGSVYSTGAIIKPPTGKVFVALQCLEDLSFTTLKAEPYINSSGDEKQNFISTSVSHSNGDHEDTDTHNDNGNNDDKVITLAAASTSVKKGMIVEHADMCPSSLTDPYRVVSVDGADITLNKSVAANKANGSNVKAQFYWERSQGFGGMALGTNGFPAGFILFGRFTSVNSNNGRLIAYIGE